MGYQILRPEAGAVCDLTQSFELYVSDDRLCLLNVQQALYTHCHINLHTKINTYAPLFRFVIGKISHQHAMQGRESSEEPIITSKHYIFFDYSLLKIISKSMMSSFFLNLHLQ